MITLVVCICFLLPLKANAAQTKMYGIYEYEVKGSKVKIVGYDGEKIDKRNIYRLVIPEEIEGKKVVSVEFYLVSELEEEVSRYIEEIVIPRYVKNIDIESIFGLEKIIVSEENPYFSSENGILYNKNKAALVRCPRLKYGKIKIPSGVKTLQRGCFFACEEVTEIVLPDSIKNIKELAFCGCEYLRTVNLPKNLKKIEGDMFAECEKLEEIKIPNSVTEIDDRAFEKCRNLKKIHIPVKVKKIGEDAFSGCDSLKEVTIPKNVMALGQGAFYKCKNLKSVSFAKKSRIDRIKVYTFDGCSKLKTIQLPPKLERIQICAFKDCDQLKEIEMPVSVEYIHKKAFSKYDKYLNTNDKTVIRGLRIKAPKGSYAYNFAEKYKEYGFEAVEN